MQGEVCTKALMELISCLSWCWDSGWCILLFCPASNGSEHQLGGGCAASGTGQTESAGRVVWRTVVHGDDVQAVEQLPLVLVDSLDVDVEHGGRVYLHPVLLLQVLGELQLVVLPGKHSQSEAGKQSLSEVTQPIDRCDLSGQAAAKRTDATHK